MLILIELLVGVYLLSVYVFWVAELHSISDHFDFFHRRYNKPVSWKDSWWAAWLALIFALVAPFAVFIERR